MFIFTVHNLTSVRTSLHEFPKYAYNTHNCFKWNNQYNIYEFVTTGQFVLRFG